MERTYLRSSGKSLCRTAVISGKSISLDENKADTHSYDAETHGCWIELLRHWGRTPSVSILDDESMLRVYLGPTVGGWNCVSHLDVDPEEADDKIYEAIMFFRPYSRPFLWYVTPSTRPRDIGERLISHGFSYLDDSPGMVAEMAELPQDYPAPEGFRIEAIEDHSGLRQYFEVWALGHKYPPHIVEPFVKLYGEIGFDEDRPDRLYLGFLDGDPVTTSMVMRVGDTASVWWVTVLPEAQQRGLGLLMTLKPLMIAQERGCRLATLFSSSAGYPQYKRLGFREHTKLSYYVWLNQDPPRQ